MTHKPPRRQPPSAIPPPALTPADVAEILRRAELRNDASLGDIRALADTVLRQARAERDAAVADNAVAVASLKDVQGHIERLDRTKRTFHAGDLQAIWSKAQDGLNDDHPGAALLAVVEAARKWAAVFHKTNTAGIGIPSDVWLAEMTLRDALAALDGKVTP